MPTKPKRVLFTVTIKRGHGFWDTTYFNIGGSFHRAKEPLQVDVFRCFPNYKGATWEGRIQGEDRKAALSLDVCESEITINAGTNCIAERYYDNGETDAKVQTLNHDAPMLSEGDKVSTYLTPIVGWNYLEVKAHIDRVRKA
jgi:hypothetical protein